MVGICGRWGCSDEQVVGDANNRCGTFGRGNPECSVEESIRDGNQNQVNYKRKDWRLLPCGGKLLAEA
jgi:hypothetical protein